MTQVQWAPVGRLNRIAQNMKTFPKLWWPCWWACAEPERLPDNDMYWHLDCVACRLKAETWILLNEGQISEWNMWCLKLTLEWMDNDGILKERVLSDE